MDHRFWGRGVGWRMYHTLWAVGWCFSAEVHCSFLSVQFSHHPLMFAPQKSAAVLNLTPPSSLGNLWCVCCWFHELGLCISTTDECWNPWGAFINYHALTSSQSSCTRSSEVGAQAWVYFKCSEMMLMFSQGREPQIWSSFKIFRGDPHSQWTFELQERESLRDIVGLVPEQCNKVNITISQVTWLFWFPSTYKSYVYTIL